MKQLNSLRLIKVSISLACVMIMPNTLPVSAIAQEVTNDTGVYGANIARADFPGGYYQMIGEREWGRFDANGTLIRKYVERRRSDWEVEFRDTTNNISASIDILNNGVFETEPNGNSLNQFATISSVAPRGDMPRIPLPKIADDAPQWMKDQWARRFDANQGWRSGASVATDSADSSSPGFSVGPSQPTESSSSQPQQSQWGSNQQTEQNGWGNQQAAPQQTQQQGNSQIPPQQQTQSQQSTPWANEQQTQSQQSTPWANEQQTQSQQSTPWANEQQTQPPQPTDSFAQYEGVWVESNKEFRERGNGENGPITWSSPKIITLRKTKDDQVILRFHREPSWHVELSKRSDTSYSDGRTTVNFSKSGSSYYLNLNSSTLPSGNFELSRTADGTFSRDRFKQGQGRDSRRGLFNQDGLTREWNNNFYSYNGVEMDLFNYRRGRRVQIFKQPGNTEYAVDDNLNLGLPWGLRGYRVRSSSSRQTETMITNASTFQDEMSFNFGGGAQTPKGSLGASYSREQTSGGSNSRSTTKALGIARIERYALIVDKPNMQLSDNFRRSLEQLIEGHTTTQQIISTYGTHYANAIHYGGLGKAEKDMTSNEISSYVSKKYSTSANAAIPGASLSGGFSQGKSSSTNQSSVFTIDEFNAVGGSGSMSLSGWSVQDSDTVPVRYDLRPLSELISPIFFPSQGNAQKSIQQSKARMALEQAIAAKMRSVPKLPNNYRGPKLYRFDFKRLYCTNNGDEGNDRTVEIYGKIAFIYHDDNGAKTIDLFDQPESSPKDIYCQSNGGIGVNLNKSSLIIMSPNSAESRRSGFGQYFVTDGQLYEDDNSIFDQDDRIEGANIAQRLVNAYARSKRSGKVTVTFGNRSADAPILNLDFTVTELK